MKIINFSDIKYNFLSTIDYLKLKTLFIYFTIFIFCNLTFSMICHLIPNGGRIFVPIYFFTLIGSYLLGWKAGIIISLMSISTNHILLGMPDDNMIMIVLIKTITISLITALINKDNILTTLLKIILLYQLISIIIDLFITNNINIVISNLINQIPGLIIQLFIGYIIIKNVKKL